MARRDEAASRSVDPKRSDRTSQLIRLDHAVSDYPGAPARVAQYIVANPEKVVHQSLAELSDFSKVGQASVARLCRELGFNGFTQFKIALSADLAVRKSGVSKDAESACDPLSKWPYSPGLADQSLEKVEAVPRHQDDIRDLTDKGIDVLVDGLKWGTSYHGAGWMPRHIEGIDLFVFYALEHLTGEKFLHGQPACLGVYIGSLLHKARAEEMLSAIHHIGLDIRPEAMGITWEQVSEALIGLKAFVCEAGLWHSIAHDVEARYGAWPA